MSASTVFREQGILYRVAPLAASAISCRVDPSMVRTLSKIRNCLRHSYTLSESVEYVRTRGCRIPGIEIDKNAAPVEHHPFEGPTAFMAGNEGTGLSMDHKSECDAFVYIKQYGDGACINVNVAAGIVLHHFAVWAGFQQNAVIGQKFQPEG